MVNSYYTAMAFRHLFALKQAIDILDNESNTNLLPSILALKACRDELIKEDENFRYAWNVFKDIFPESTS